MPQQHQNWQCPKCGNRHFDVGEFHAAGGTWAKVFDVSNKKFSTLSCTKCGFTEIYRANPSDLTSVLDFLTT